MQAVQRLILLESQIEQRSLSFHQGTEKMLKQMLAAGVFQYLKLPFPCHVCTDNTEGSKLQEWLMD